MAGNEAQRRTQKEFEYKGYWLEKRPTSAYWYRVNRVAKNQKYEKISLGETDIGAAKNKLIEFADRQLDSNRGDPGIVKLFPVLDFYYEKHGKSVRSQKMQAAGIRIWKDNFTDTTTISNLTPEALRTFTENLKKQGMSLGYVDRVLGVGKTALNFARDQLILSAVPKIKSAQTQEDRENVDPLGRPLTMEELATLFVHCPCPHIQLFMLIQLNTAARPEAILQLTRLQIDFDHNLINLNQKGRRQTKKRRPILKMTKGLQLALKEVERKQVEDAQSSGTSNFHFRYYISFRGKPVRNITRAWAGMVENAGLGGTNITRYSIRHTVGRLLRAARVPTEEISLYLGHKLKNVSDATMVYSPFDPEYCISAVSAIEAFTDKLQIEIEKLLQPKNVSSSA